MPGTEKEWDTLIKNYSNAARSRSDVVGRTESLQRNDDRAFDAVTKPEHYNSGGIECIEAIKASMSAEEFKGYLKGNALKYLWRYSYKGKPKQDLEKAKWYLERLIESVQ